MAQNKRSSCDYPFYKDEPVSVSATDWIIVLLALALGFAMLTQVPHFPFLNLTIDGLLRQLLFGGIPLAAFAWRVGRHSRAIFNGWRWSYLGWGVLIGVLNLVFTLVIGILAQDRMELANNSVGEGLSQGVVPGGPALFYLGTGVQLFGEEVFTILPFLFLLWLATRTIALPRAGAIVIAWIGSAIVFGSMHLPAYHWNLVQAFLLIGPVRLVLTLAYMKTKSIWASTIAHVVNDWTMFTFLMVVSFLGLRT